MKPMGEHDIYSTAQHLAFNKSNRYLIKTQGNWLLERWMFDCLVVYLEYLSYFQEAAQEIALLFEYKLGTSDREMIYVPIWREQLP